MAVAVIYAVVIPAILVIRILNEEKILKNELEGYKDYCHKTKYLFIEFINNKINTK